MWKTIQIRDDRYLQDLAEMAEEHYGPDNIIARKDYLRHEYFKNPAGDAIVQAACDEEKGLMAGQCAAVPMIVKIGADDYSCLMFGNVLTRSSYRGQGVFRDLAFKVCERASRAGYELIYTMPNQYSFPTFIRHLGFRETGRVSLYVRPLCPSAMVRSYLKSPLLAAAAGCFDGFFRPGFFRPGFFRPKETAMDRKQVRLAGFKSNAEKYADEFWRRIKGDYPVMIRRDHEYLKWRFIECPHRAYHGYYALDGDRPVAFVLGRNMEVSGLHCAMIADFLFVKGYEEHAQRALRQLLLELMKQGAEMAGCMVPPRSKERRLLTKAGFFQCPRFLEPQPFRFVFRHMRPGQTHGTAAAARETDMASDLRNWFFTMGDYDVV